MTLAEMAEIHFNIGSRRFRARLQNNLTEEIYSEDDIKNCLEL